LLLRVTGGGGWYSPAERHLVAQRKSKRHPAVADGLKRNCWGRLCWDMLMC
jgi:hypothetical protein